MNVYSQCPARGVADVKLLDKGFGQRRGRVKRGYSARDGSLTQLYSSNGLKVSHASPRC